MNVRRIASAAVVVWAGIGFAAPLAAQQPVKPLQDLIGARGSSGEEQLRSRGYTFVRGDKSGDAAYTYWRQPQTNRCLSVRTEDGRYAAIVFTPDADCQAAPGGGSAGATGGSEDSFDTVCGIEVGGQTYRYRCHLHNQGCAPGGGGPCRTTVTMPDNEYVITWHKNDEIDVTFAGMAPKRSKSSFQHGQTRFQFEDKVFFVYREKSSGQRELAKLP